LKLTDAQFDALRNLARKKAGEVVGWIDIGEARGLTDLGFAERNRSGWQITDAGVLMLAHWDGRAEPAATCNWCPRRSMPSTAAPRCSVTPSSRSQPVTSRPASSPRRAELGVRSSEISVTS